MTSLRSRGSALLRGSILGLLVGVALMTGVAPIVRSAPTLPATPSPHAIHQSSERAAGNESVRAAHRLGEALRERASLPGLAIAVGHGDSIVYSEAFGVADLETRAPATPLTRWRVGSVSKSFTATAAALLAERGQLDLDASLDELLPGWSDRPAGSATPRQLAGHLAGIRHYREGEGIGHTRYESVSGSLERFADDSLVAPPGTDYAYSTYGYTLLSALLERASGQSFLDLMRDEIFEPLDMRHTGPDLATEIVPWRASFYEIREGRVGPAPFTDNSYKWAGGGFLSTPEDMVRFGSALLDERLVGRTGLERLFTSQQTHAGEDTGYGMGFRPRTDRKGRRVVHHGGSSEGSRAFLLLYPAQKLVVALAANRATAPLFEEEAMSFAHLFLEHGAGREGRIDHELSGAWRVDGTLGDNRVDGSLRLYDEGATRGILEWSDSGTPIHVVLTDRHDENLHLFGVGPHGVMNAWLEPALGGWKGNWEYLGREGRLIVAVDRGRAATCSAGQSPAESTAPGSAP